MKLFLLLLFIILANSVFSQTDSLRIYYNQSMEAYENKAWDLYLENAVKFNRIHPTHPAMTYNLASAYALNGKLNEASEALKRALFINADQSFEDDEDFQRLHQTDLWQGILDFRNGLLERIQTGTTLHIHDPSVDHAESVTYLPEKQVLLIGTVRKPSLISYDLNTRNTRVILPFDSLTSHYAFTSVYYDDLRDRIYLTGTAMPEVVTYEEDKEGKSVIIILDQEGQLLEQFQYEGHKLQDIIRVENKLLVSDGLVNSIFEVTEKGLEEFINLRDTAYNLQSMAYDARNQRLFVADYIKGIYAVNIISKSAYLVREVQDNLILKGIDGLEYADGYLYALHNGIHPKKVIRYRLENEFIQSFEVLEQNIGTSGEPTSAVMGDEKLYYIANSPWDAYESGQWKQEKAHPLEIRILTIK